MAKRGSLGRIPSRTRFSRRAMFDSTSAVGIPTISPAVCVSRSSLTPKSKSPPSAFANDETSLTNSLWSSPLLGGSISLYSRRFVSGATPTSAFRSSALTSSSALYCMRVVNRFSFENMLVTLVTKVHGTLEVHRFVWGTVPGVRVCAQFGGAFSASYTVHDFASVNLPGCNVSVVFNYLCVSQSFHFNSSSGAACTRERPFGHLRAISRTVKSPPEHRVTRQGCVRAHRAYQSYTGPTIR